MSDSDQSNQPYNTPVERRRPALSAEGSLRHGAETPPRDPMISMPWRKEAPILWHMPAVEALDFKNRHRLTILMNIATQSPRRWYITEDDETLAKVLQLGNVTNWIRWAAKRMEARLLFALEDGSWLLNPRLFAYEDHYPPPPDVRTSIEALAVHAIDIGPGKNITALVSEDAERQILRRAFVKFVDWLQQEDAAVPNPELSRDRADAQNYELLREAHRNAFLPHYRATGERSLTATQWRALSASLPFLARKASRDRERDTVTQSEGLERDNDVLSRSDQRDNGVTEPVTSHSPQTPQDTKRGDSESEDKEKDNNNTLSARDVTRMSRVNVTPNGVTSQPQKSVTGQTKNGVTTLQTLSPQNGKAIIISDYSVSDPSSLRGDLINVFGVSPPVADDFVQRFPPEHIRECMKWVRIQHPGKEIENTGMLVHFIKGNWKQSGAVTKELARLEEEEKKAAQQEKALRTNATLQVQQQTQTIQRSQFWDALSENERNQWNNTAFARCSKNYPAVINVMCEGDKNRLFIRKLVEAELNLMLDAQIALEAHAGVSEPSTASRNGTNVPVNVP